MAPHFSVLAWRIPGTGEPGGVPSMRSPRVGNDWSDLAAAAAADRPRDCHTDWRKSEKKKCYITYMWYLALGKLGFIISDKKHRTGCTGAKESAERRWCADSSRSMMGSSFLANKFPFLSKRPMKYFQWKKNKNKNKEMIPFAATWMDLEIISLNEVRQRKSSIIWCRLCVESLKNHTN